MQNTNFVTELLIILLILLALGIIYYYTRRIRKGTPSKNNYLAALEHLVDGEYKRAIQKFKEAVREDTENIEAYLRLGDLLRERGMSKNALKIHKDLTFRSSLPEEVVQKVNWSLMLDYEVMGELDKAAEIAQKLLEKDGPYSREAANKLLHYLEQKGEWEEAYNACKKFIKPIPAHLKKRLALYQVFEGLQLMDQDEGRDARIKFKDALKNDPKCAAAYYYLGKSYVQEERLEDAIREWNNLCKKIPEKAHVVFDSLEKAWFELGRFAEAEKLYTDLLSSDGTNVYAALALAEIYDKKGDYDLALDLLERIESNHPDDPRIVGRRIKILFNKGQYKIASSKAIDYFKQHNLLENRKYICQECHYQSIEPLWICPQCKSIDSFNI